MAKWPSSVPGPIVEGVSYTSQSNFIRTEMDGGLAKMRRRNTRVPEQVGFTIVCGKAQMQIIYDFVSITLGDVMQFEWVEFRDPSRRPAMYRFLERPTYTPITGTLWQVSLRLELLTPFNGQFPLANESLQIITDGNDNGLTT